MSEANIFVDFVLSVLKAQAKTGGKVLLEHPEDLGRRRQGDPGSVWRWPQVKELAERHGLSTGALLQSSWGRAFPKPTRFLHNLPAFERDLRPGWPTFEKDSYIGPLEKETNA